MDVYRASVPLIKVFYVHNHTVAGVFAQDLDVVAIRGSEKASIIPEERVVQHQPSMSVQSEYLSNATYKERMADDESDTRWRNGNEEYQSRADENPQRITVID